MGKPANKSRLSQKLLAAALISLLIGVGFFYLLNSAAESWIGQRYKSGALQKTQVAGAIGRFQKYVGDSGISTGDWDALHQWCRREKYMYLIIAKDNRIVFDSFFTQEEFQAYYDESYQDEYLHGSGNYGPASSEITFSNGIAKVYFIGDYESREYFIATVTAVILAAIAAMICFLAAIRGKTRYIVRLRDELRILETGDLNYSITIKGNDELEDLASGIDSMRLAFMERLDSEERIHTANQNLVTAMSHDLRSPLTSLIGYLEILAHEKYTDQEQMQKYVRSSRTKAYQMKELSDKLFSYFLASDMEDDEPKYQCLHCLPLLEQIVSEGVFDLESEGFTVEYIPLHEPCSMEGDINLLRRGFSNLFSNITRYADHEKPVKIACELLNNCLRISFRNDVRENRDGLSGSGIGLKVCGLMAAEHKGEFTCHESEGEWTAKISLPVSVQEQR